MTATPAPERIWLYKGSPSVVREKAPPENFPGWNEYLRADLALPLPATAARDPARVAEVARVLPPGVELHMVRHALRGMSTCGALTTFQRINAGLAADLLAALAAADGAGEGGERG